MLNGDNGLLRKTTEAKAATEIAQAIEQAKMDIIGEIINKAGNTDKSITDLQVKEILEKYFNNVPDDFTDQTKTITTKTGGYSVKIAEVLSGTNVKIVLPEGTGTKPYLPKNNGTWNKVAGTNFNNGLVISDNQGNEYVWIEVPRTSAVYGNTFNMNYNFNTMSEQEKTNAFNAIKEKLIAYAGFPTDGTWSSGGENAKTKRCGWKDEWYDKNNKKVTDTGAILTNTEGCGLTSSDYTLYYNTMLQSVYENGGFWIGRYETGIQGTEIGENENNKTGSRTHGTAYTTEWSTEGFVPVIKANVQPYNWVRCYQAQQLANSMNSGEHKSSLMFGLQWDLVIKYLEQKASWNSSTATSNLKADSQYWGNYNNTLYNITNTKACYSTDNGANWTKANPCDKNANGNRLLTTGANADFNKQNIFDLAGNAWEWTLEHATSDVNNSCARRGGSSTNPSSNYPASSRGDNNANRSSYNFSFRVSIY